MLLFLFFEHYPCDFFELNLALYVWKSFSTEIGGPQSIGRLCMNVSGKVLERALKIESRLNIDLAEWRSSRFYRQLEIIHESARPGSLSLVACRYGDADSN